MDETQKYRGTLTIEHVTNGYLLTTGTGNKMVAQTENDAMKAIASMFKSVLPAQGESCTISIELIK